jgi:hypothetical protein
VPQLRATRSRAALLVPKPEIKEEENEVTALLRQQPRDDSEADPSGAVKDGPADWDYNFFECYDHSVRHRRY